MKLAPIVLFVYNRPNHTKKSLDYLKKNKLAKKSIIYIFSDAPKNKQSKNKVAEVRKLIHNLKGFKKKKIIIRKKNFGLSKNIINGVTQICNKYGKIIVLEDDILTTPFFLRYMNDALNLYSNNHNVSSISGYSFPINNKKKEYYFLRLSECWGWATWKRSWSLFEKDGNKILKNLNTKKKSYDFNFEDTFNFLRMLKNFCLGKNDSWAIRWYGQCFLQKKLTLFPPKSFIENIGMDNSGNHSINTNNYKSKLIKSYKKPKMIIVKESRYHFEEMKKFFKKTEPKKNLILRIKNYLFNKI